MQVESSMTITQLFQLFLKRYVPKASAFIRVNLADTVIAAAILPDYKMEPSKDGSATTCMSTVFAGTDAEKVKADVKALRSAGVRVVSANASKKQAVWLYSLEDGWYQVKKPFESKK